MTEQDKSVWAKVKGFATTYHIEISLAAIFIALVALIV